MHLCSSNSLDTINVVEIEVIIIIQCNSIQFFIIYVPSPQPQGQLETRHSVDTSNYIMGKYYIKSKTNYRQALEEKHVNVEK
jgi:hypothetical protein